MTIRCLPASDRALLIELADLRQALALFDALQAQRPDGVLEMVPAARTILLEFAPYATTAARVWQQVQQQWQQLALNAVDAGAAAAALPQGHLVEVPVVYDGADLPQLAEWLNITPAELIERHTSGDYQAAFAGFAPGFVYLAGGHSSFDRIPRLSSPRTKVPAGSVALAGFFSAVYPKDSPGGWQLIGTTAVAMWDLNRAEPAFIQPGFRVRFVDVTHAGRVVVPVEPRTSACVEADKAIATADLVNTGAHVSAWQIQVTGLQTIFQDLGRLGKTGMGVSASGALDRGAMRAANRLVGNPVDTPVLEQVIGGLQWCCTGSSVVAVTGARVAVQLKTTQGQQVRLQQDRALALDAGDCVTLGATTAGLRCYVAVRGGFTVTPVLDSCATDTLAMVGPPALRAGDVLQVGDAVPTAALQAVAMGGEAASPECLEAADQVEAGLAKVSSRWPRVGDEIVLDVTLGPRTDWFDAPSLARLTAQVWEVTAQSNRIGIRLMGAEPLQRQAAFAQAELPSEGTVVGALQVPANGQPVLFLADHPLTGGYPVIGAVASHHLDLAAQIPPGAKVRFRVVQPFAVWPLNGATGVDK